jgi:hypothetical protein
VAWAGQTVGDIPRDELVALEAADISDRFNAIAFYLDIADMLAKEGL